ncbi:testis-expressed protein 264-like isoform X2 [Cimex lectularius]|uniref:Uncharacterized protein n=1 Tax=Cimex lectularius TaxID=79782 RepID=A0A8I6S1P1_CIMLE|nr:testis-expressed protein 264-like isoform X2 [Cimex lectularius]
MLVFLLSLVILSLVIFYILYCYFVEVKVGPPPIKELVLAYKIIKLCYCGPEQSSKLEFAQGLILDENWKKDQVLLGNLINSDLSFFKTPEISNALYSEYFIIPWLPITIWIAVALAYRKHYKFCENYNLCGYPILEIYADCKLLIFIPLLQQDDFVVLEAERIVYGRNTSAMLMPLTRAPLAVNDSINKVKTIKRKSAKIPKSPRDNKG